MLYVTVGDPEKAAESVASYLLFHPDDAIMLANKQFYTIEYNLTDTHFVPRPEAAAYFHRDQHEMRIINFVEAEFDSPDDHKRSKSTVRHFILNQQKYGKTINFESADYFHGLCHCYCLICRNICQLPML